MVRYATRGVQQDEGGLAGEPIRAGCAKSVPSRSGTILIIACKSRVEPPSRSKRKMRQFDRTDQSRRAAERRLKLAGMEHRQANRSDAVAGTCGAGLRRIRDASVQKRSVSPVDANPWRRLVRLANTEGESPLPGRLRLEHVPSLADEVRDVEPRQRIGTDHDKPRAGRELRESLAGLQGRQRAFEPPQIEMVFAHGRSNG